MDIDPQAVEVTKLSLVLKVLEGESLETINSQIKLFDIERVLPDLNRNIQCGNSLVESDVLDHMTLAPSEENSLNPFDWDAAFPDIMKAGGFHVVIGNPPYDVLEKNRDAESWPHELLRDYLPYRPDYLPSMGYKVNLYRVFAVQALSLTRPDGEFGMIVPMSLVGDISTTSTRKHMLSVLTEPSFDCFPQKDNPARRVFKRAKLSTVVVTGTKTAKHVSGTSFINIRVFPGNDLSEQAIENRITVADCSLLDPDSSPIPLVDETEWDLCKRIHSDPSVRRLADLADSYAVTRGEVNQTTYRRYISTVAEGRARLLKGVEIGAFEIRGTLSQGQREWLDQQKLIKDHPRKAVPPERRIAMQRITGVDERQRLVSTIVAEPVWFADSANSISLLTDSALDLDYLVALLNSDLMQWRFRLTSTNNNVGTNELLALPIRVPQPRNAADEDSYQAIRSAGQRISSIKTTLAANRSPATGDQLRRRLDRAWGKLNEAVDDFYGLSRADRELVANRLARKPVAAALETPGESA